MHCIFQRFCALASVIVLIVICSRCAADPSAAEQTDLELVTVTRGALATGITATGSVYPRTESTLSFEIGGRMTEVLVEIGDRVTKGDRLASLDTADLRLNVRSAEVALTAAGAQLAQLQEGPRLEDVAAAESQLQAAQALLSQAVAQRDQLKAGATEADIASAEAQLAAAMAEQKAALHLHNKTMECKRIDLPDGSTKEICPSLGDPEEEARYNLHAADLAIAAAQAQLDAVSQGAGSRLRAAEAAVWAAAAQRDVAQAQLDLVKLGASEAELAAAEASVEQAEVALDQARLALDRAALNAPFDGVVADVTVTPGEFVAPNLPILQLVDYQHFLIKGNIDEADIGWVEQGASDVAITLDAFPGHAFNGTITVIAPSATFDVGLVSYEVTVEIGATDLTLRDGMTANMEIVRDRREDALLVPNLAIWIDPDTGQQFVERQAGETTEIVFIEQGIADEQFSEVLGGVNEGDQLIVRTSSMRDRFREVMTSSMTGQNE